MSVFSAPTRNKIYGWRGRFVPLMTTLPRVFSWGYRCHHVRRKQDLHQQKNVVLMHIDCGSSERNLSLENMSFGSSQSNISASINCFSSQKNLESVSITIYYGGFCCQWYKHYGSLLKKMIHYRLLHNNSLSLIRIREFVLEFILLFVANKFVTNIFVFLCAAAARLGPRHRPNTFRHKHTL